jgi:hypothetical protein
VVGRHQAEITSALRFIVLQNAAFWSVKQGRWSRQGGAKAGEKEVNFGLLGPNFACFSPFLSRK